MRGMGGAGPSGCGPDLSRIGIAVAGRSVGANLFGAVVTYVYLQFLAPDAFGRAGPETNLWLSVVVLSAYMATTLGIGEVVLSRVFSAQWLVEARDPTAAERRRALVAPRRLTAFTATAWYGAAVLFGALNAAVGNPGVVVAHVVVGILLGGLVTTTITYLLAERQYRPVMVLALGGEPLGGKAGAIRRRLLLAWSVGSAVPLVALGVTPFEHRGHGFVSLSVSIATLAAIGLLSGYLFTATTAAAVSEPLSGVRRALDAVRRGDLSAGVAVDDPGEIGLLQADLNRMVAGLRERRRLQELFGRHVGEEVARRALAEEAVLGGRHREVSVLVVDLIGSTALAATRPPDEIVRLLNRLFGCVVEAVTAEGGWVNKFEGDGALCIFGAPEELPDHARAALRAARTLRRMLGQARRTETALDAGIGVAAGTVVAGNVGAVDRYEYTVIGDPVNEAARLSELAKSSPSRLLASATVVGAAGDEGGYWQAETETVLRGRAQATLVMAPAPDGPGLVDQPPATAGTIETV
ncbi:MAG: adenylate/guanylate cyclase domain-containing protein [Acidobacteriota bacterium]|nr:adenylate/guanylate cyclase domain-containing protein [Acidobacteriota bacterium]